MPFFLYFIHNTQSQGILWPKILPRDFVAFSQKTFVIVQSQTMWNKLSTEIESTIPSNTIWQEWEMIYL